MGIRVRITSHEDHYGKIKKMLIGSIDWFKMATAILEEKYSQNQVEEICRQLNGEENDWHFEASVVRVMRRKR